MSPGLYLKNLPLVRKWVLSASLSPFHKATPALGLADVIYETEGPFGGVFGL
jgi:hypothetical protein